MHIKASIQTRIVVLLLLMTSIGMTAGWRRPFDALSAESLAAGGYDNCGINIMSVAGAYEMKQATWWAQMHTLLADTVSSTEQCDIPDTILTEYQSWFKNYAVRTIQDSTTTLALQDNAIQVAITAMHLSTLQVPVKDLEIQCADPLINQFFQLYEEGNQKIYWIAFEAECSKQFQRSTNGRIAVMELLPLVPLNCLTSATVMLHRFGDKVDGVITSSYQDASLLLHHRLNREAR